MARESADEAGLKPRPTDHPTDVLSDVLEAVRLTGALFFFVEATPPWVSEAPDGATLLPAILPGAGHLVSYHVVTAGRCWCALPGNAPIELWAGDVLVVPHGDAYGLSSAPGMASSLTIDETLGWFRSMAVGRLPFVVAEGEGRSPASLGLICGFLGCDALPFNPVLSMLPRAFRVAKPAEGNDAVATLVDLAAAESCRPQAGSRSVLLRIAELMFVEVVRRHVMALPDDARSWLSGLRDPLVGRTLTALHAEPARAWTLDALAREVAVSRSSLTERFTQFVGLPPMHYLARWRMQIAAGRLAGAGAKVSAVAQDIGYDSEAAFSRAFKKATGVSPAAWRQGNRKRTAGTGN